MMRRIFLILFTALSFAHAAEIDFSRDVTPFIQQHCGDCHGADVQKAKLRLDTLKPSFGEKENADCWIKALDKMSAGQMPPASETRPKPEELTAITSWLTRQLHDASLAKQQQEGRVLLRRLNRTEYENTLHDLLSVSTEIADLLPDDNIAAGFDNVSTALDLSSAHFLRYQDAAELALADAVPFRAPKLYKDRKTGKELVADKNSTAARGIGKSTTLKDDAVVLWVRLPRYAAFVNYPYGMQPGRYRLKISASAINNNGKSMPVVFSRIRESTRDDGEPLSCQDVQPDKPTELVQEFELRPKERLQVTGWTLPSENEFNNKHKTGIPADYAGPGLAIQWMELEGPLNAFPSEGYHKLFGDLPLKAKSVLKAEADHKPIPKINEKRSNEEWLKDPLTPVSTNAKADSEKLLRSFLPLAFRRPAEEESIQYFQHFALERIEKGYTFGDAMLAAYKAALCSPSFLILREQAGAGLDGYALASRLSYFIWRSMPDAELIALARDGSLAKPEIIHAQLERLLHDPKAKRFEEDFVGQWLDMRKIDSTSPDPQLYGEFDRYLLWSMPRETELFFSEMLEKNLGVTQIVDSNWTFVNERLAQHYGIKDVAGCAFQKVSVPPESHRGGILTHASVLKVTADGTRTSPILRGKWVLERIIGKPPQPPPPDVPAIEPDIRGATTIRQQLEKHRNTKACNACHKYIDPPGFALETFDVIGGWRDFYRISKYSKTKLELKNYPGQMVGKGLDVEKGDKTPDGRVFKDITDYKKILLEDKDQLARNLVQKLMIFGTGAEIQFADREVVEQIVDKARQSDFGIRTILHEIAGSRVFLNK